MIKKKFMRRVESFVCLKCQKFVQGDGYTNHCPFCLWSRHVDVFPGDREASCQGLMEPIEFEEQGNGQWIHHRCQACGFEKRNKRQKTDSFSAILELIRRSR
jgi:hypothetical protein